MAKTGMLKSRTSTAAMSSCVESGLDAQSATSAPPSRKVMARFAVSAVTWRQAAMRMPFSGWFLMNSLRMDCSTFMDWFAHSRRFLPMSASSMLLMSQGTVVAVVVAILYSRLSAIGIGLAHDDGILGMRSGTDLIIAGMQLGSQQHSE